MLKAILYYFLFIVVFFITIVFTGFLFGIYLAYIEVGASKGYFDEKSTAALTTPSSPFIMGMLLLCMLVIWQTFRHYKFSKFSLGKVVPTYKWKAIAYGSMPLLGITMVYYAITNLLHIDWLPKEMTEIEYPMFLPYAIFGSFISAYVFYGAIQEELILNGKKRWVQCLTLCLMMIPASILTASTNGDFSLDLTFIGIVSTCYCCWFYEKTRSSIVLFACYFISNLVPFKFDSIPLGIALVVVGIPLTIFGIISLRKNLTNWLQQDESK